jgi:D-arabinose 1-dehydrogenase-like Zn-dependent alcohol dehydrogenase
VYGLGCNEFTKNQLDRERGLQRRIHASYDAVEVYCQPHTKHQLANIARAVFRVKTKKDLNQIASTLFAHTLVVRVLNHLQRGKKVVLVGHSHGGHVVTQVARQISNYVHTAPKNLQILTLGSITVVDPATLPLKNLKFTQAKYIHDIARVCSKTCPKITKNVMWLRPKNGLGPLGQHMDYNGIVEHIATLSPNKVSIRNILRRYQL